MAFGAGKTCHYIWNETTGSDFRTPCTYTSSGDMVTYTATADADDTAGAGNYGACAEYPAAEVCE
ncbi:MAG: hypothetical protein FJ104_05270 [Deltaproteobacteria bacterium]|nr:hypothetical protein [Deltaproteobacteria bacterium]